MKYVRQERGMTGPPGLRYEIDRASKCTGGQTYVRSRRYPANPQNPDPIKIFGPPPLFTLKIRRKPLQNRRDFAII